MTDLCGEKKSGTPSNGNYIEGNQFWWQSNIQILQFDT